MLPVYTHTHTQGMPGLPGVNGTDGLSGARGVPGKMVGYTCISVMAYR